jgi:hypothetical protein
LFLVWETTPAARNNNEITVNTNPQNIIRSRVIHRPSRNASIAPRK